MNAEPPTKRAMLAFELKAAFFRAKRFATDARGATRRWPIVPGRERRCASGRQFFNGHVAETPAISMPASGR